MASWMDKDSLELEEDKNSMAKHDKPDTDHAHTESQTSFASIVLNKYSPMPSKEVYRKEILPNT